MLFFNEDKSELIATCKCGCDEGIHIRLDDELHKDYNLDEYCYQSYIKNDDTVGYKGGKLKTKFKKIWSVITEKDYYYSDVIMTGKDVEILRDYLTYILDKNK